jgi:hypothetical protein
MSQISRVRFDNPVAGGRSALSPSSCLLAYVERGTTVVVEDVATAFYRVLKGEPKSPNVKLPKPDRPVAKYVALDEITDLLWSPDSTAIALWMAPRASIEVISATTLSSIARIDGGLNGMRQMHWHPSSRCLYWFGSAESFALSLVDGTTMAFEHPIKVVGPMSYSSWAMRDRALLVAASSGLARSSRTSVVRECGALFAFSRDSQYIFTLSPCEVEQSVEAIAAAAARERLGLDERGYPDATEYGSAVAHEVRRVDFAAVDESLPVSAEAFRVFDSTTHATLSEFPIDMTLETPTAPDSASTNKPKFMPPVLGSVTAFWVAASCIVFFDHPNMHVVLTSLDGLRRVGEFTDIAACDVSPDAGLVLLVDAKRELLVVIACIYGRTHRMGDIPLRPSYLAPATPILTETPTNDTDDLPPPEGHRRNRARETAATTKPRSSYSLAMLDAVLMTFDDFTADSLARRDVTTIFAQAYFNVERRRSQATRDPERHRDADRGDASLDAALAASAAAARVEVSPCGRFGAVVTPRYPTCVFIAEVAKESNIVCVLRHTAAVACVSWRGASSPADPAAATAKPALAVATDSRSGNIYLWTGDSAMCVSAPLESHTAATDAMPTSGTCITRLSWGDSGRALLLSDDLTETFCVAELVA